MPARKRTVEIEVVVDDKQVKQKLGNVDQTVAKTGKGFSNFAKLAAGAFSVGAVVEFGRETVRAFSDLNESTNAVNVSFGQASKGVLELGKNAAESVGLSNAAFNQLAVGFSAFVKQIAAAQGTDVTSVVEELTTRISDFASVMNLEVAEAAEKFRSGLAGETEPLRAFGINVAASAVSQRALSMGLAETTRELTEGDKILARYSLIMEQTEQMAGDFANTSEELANAQRIANAEFENAKAALGENFAPTARDVTGFFSDLTTLLDAAADGFGKLTGESDASLFSFMRHTPILGDLINVIEQSAEWLGKDSEALQKVKLSADEFAAGHAAMADEVHGGIRVYQETKAALDEVVPSADALAAALERQENAAKAAREEQIALRDALRNIHNPIFRAWELSQDLAEAQDDAAEASKKGAKGHDDYVAASIRAAGITAELEAIFVDLRKDGIEPTGAAARTMLEGLDLPRDVINEILAEFDRLERDFENRRFAMTLTMPALPRPGARATGPGAGIRSHEGEVIPGPPGSEHLRILEGGETVLPADHKGPIPGMSAASHLTQIFVSNPSALLIRELAEQARRGG